MDWKRRLSFAAVMLCALSARAETIGESAAQETYGPPAPVFESPMNPEQCQLGGRRFGCHRHPLKKRIRMHTGWDFQARPKGTPELRAIGDGEVVKIGRLSRACGLGLKIKLKNGLFTHYCHMSKLEKFKPGDPVKAAQVVGRMGGTGKVSGPHLHFVVAKCEDGEGCAIDPASILDPDKMCKESVPDATRPGSC